MAKAKKEQEQQKKASEGRVYMKNNQGFKVEVIDKPDHVEKLKELGWTEV